MTKTALASKVFHIHGGAAKGEPLYLTVPAFDQTDLTRHCFSTRIGGVSQGNFSSLNLSFSRGDVFQHVRINYELLCGCIGIDFRDLVFSDQTHSTHCEVVRRRDRGKGITRRSGIRETDGLLTNRPRVPLVTLYADCVPLLLLDTKTPAIASVHAGWRGTVNKIAQEALALMRDRFGTDPKDVLAAVMPSIGPCCFEVDPPVAEAFFDAFDRELSPFIVRHQNGKSNIDMQGLNAMLLQSAGVPADNITVSDLCTKCHSDVFYSHRVQGDNRGSLAAILQLK